MGADDEDSSRVLAGHLFREELPSGAHEPSRKHGFALRTASTAVLSDALPLLPHSRSHSSLEYAVLAVMQVH